MEPTIIGIIGCGSISGAYLSGAARSPLVRVKSVADIRADAADAQAREHGVQAVPIDTLLADPDIEIVVNLTVPAAHAPVSLRIIEAGKHVYLEKPLATRFAEAKPVMQAAAAKGLRVGCAPDTFLGAGASGLPLRDRRWLDRRPGRRRRIGAVARHGTLAPESGVLLPAWRRTDPRYGPVLRDAACQSARAGLARGGTGLDREQDAPDHQRAAGRTDHHCRSAHHGQRRAVVRQWRQCVAEPLMGCMEAQAIAARDLWQRRQHAGAGSELLRRRAADHPARWRLDAAGHLRSSVRRAQPGDANRRAGCRLPHHRPARHGGCDPRRPPASRQRHARPACAGGAGRVRAFIARRPSHRHRDAVRSAGEAAASAAARRCLHDQDDARTGDLPGAVRRRCRAVRQSARHRRLGGGAWLQGGADSRRGTRGCSISIAPRTAMRIATR